ncbi:MAG: hypothetical protein EOO38_05285 [Cytophagaceae bacterium]|nr:MAG: hypothetical protein EOO38_05285 [Cytophagaceae bacterium]
MVELMRAMNASIKPKTPEATAPSILKGKVVIGKNGKVSLAAANDDVWSKYPEIMAYSGSSKVQKMIDVALENSNWVLSQKNRSKVSRRVNYYSTGNCLRHVKQALVVAGITDSYINASRVNRPEGLMLERLREKKFVNLLNDPKYSSIITNAASAPKGALLVYAGGGNGGHIEIKTGFGNTGTYVSDFQQSQTIMQNALGGRSSKNYRLIGVMVKPGV